MATAPNVPAAKPAGVTQHVDKGKEDALGIGRNGKLLNTHCEDLQWSIEDIRDEFLELRTIYINDVRHDVMRNGLLGEIVSRTPILVYDLPELKDQVDTAFVDMSGKMYISDTFARRIIAEHKAGLDSANFLIRHEGDHLRRMHMSVRQQRQPHPRQSRCNGVALAADPVQQVDQPQVPLHQGALRVQRFQQPRQVAHGSGIQALNAACACRRRR